MFPTRPRTIARTGLHGAVVAVLVAAGVVLVNPMSAAAATNLVVDTSADTAATEGACASTGITTQAPPLSLREATCLANNIGGDVAIAVPAGTYPLLHGELQLGAASGSTVTVTGAGSGSTVIDGGGTGRVFDLDRGHLGGVTIGLSGLTATDGSDSTFGGGAIVGGSGNAATPDILTLDSVVISNSQAAVGLPTASNDEGGGLQVIGGSLSITNSTISGNGANSSAGSGVYYAATGTASGEQLTVDNTTFSGNHATAGIAGTPNGGALAINAAGTTASVTNSRFLDNTVVGSSGTPVGAGLWARDGTVTVTGSTFTGNSVTGGTSPSGGAMQLDNPSSTLHYNRITGNTAAAGSAAAVATTASATDNWWGCNGGPGSAGCDTVTGGINDSPRLVLTTAATPATVTGPAASSTVTAALTTDSLGTAVAPASLGAFDALPVTFGDPVGDATVGGSAGAKPVALASGAATVSFQSASTSGPVQIIATFDQASVTATVTVDQAPAITGAATAGFTIGSAGSFTVTTTGYPAPALTETGALPAGLSFADNHDGTATISGTPAAGGSFGVTIGADNGVAPAASKALSVTATAAPAITSAAATTFTAGSPGSFTVTTTGYPAPTLSEAGALPAGISLTDHGDGTATLTGTPAAGTGGAYSITLTAANGISPDASQPFTLTVDEAPAVTTNPSGQSVNPGSVVTFNAAAGGYPTPTVQWQRSTDGGATFTAIAGATSNSYTFTAAAGDNGSRYQAVFSNVVNSATSTTATLSVVQAPAFTSADTATFAVAAAGSFLVTTSGLPNAAVRATGTPPAWLTLTDHGDGTATLAGTPPVGAGGSYSIALSASNGVNPAATQAFTLDVDESPSFTSPNHATFTAGAAGTFAVTTAAGFPAATAVSESGPLPGGVTFTPNNSGGGSLAGTPAAGTGGTYPITFAAAAVGGSTAPASQIFTLTVTAAPTLTSADHVTFAVGAAGSFTVTSAAGFPVATTISSTGTLPTGVTFTDHGDGTATLAGTPALNSGGSYPLTITATNGVHPDALQSFTLTVDEPPFIVSQTHATFGFGTAGQFTVVTAPGVPASTTITETGPLPAGVSFADNSDGTATIGGTPTASGVFVITIDAGNGVAPDDVQTFTLTVTRPPTLTSAAAATFAVGQPGTFTITTTGGYPAATTISRTGTLPAGVSFTDNGDGTATLSGTPAIGTGGTYPLSITAANGIAPAATQSFSLTVTEKPAFTSGSSATFHVGAAASYPVTTAAGFPSATTLTETGTLPGGITFADHGDGTAALAGTPTGGTGGAYPLTLTAANSVGSTSQSFTLTVTEAAAITSADHATMLAGTAGVFTVTTSGGFPTPPALSHTGALPPGITMVDNGDGTATLAGTTTVDGVFALSIVASNGSGTDTRQAFTLTVQAPPTFTSADHTTFTLASPGTFTVTTRAGTPPGRTITETGALPAGVTLVDNGDGTATLAGTPSTGGVFGLTLTASNGVGTDATQAFTLTVNASPAVTSADHTTFTTGTPAAFTVTTTPGTPSGVVLSVAGALPAGVTFVDNGDGTATLGGTPAAGTGGGYPLSITASNGLVPPGSQSFMLTVDELPIITSTDHATFTAGARGTFTVTTTAGYPARTALSESGSLPAGVMFTDNGDGTATLTGTAAATGSFPVRLTAANGVGTGTGQPFTLTVAAASSIVLPIALPPASGQLDGVPAHTRVGQVLHISGSGLAAGAPVIIGIYSTPTTLAQVRAGSNGAFTASITVPHLLGHHTFTAAATGADGRPRYLEAASTISEPLVVSRAGGQLADTGLQTDPRGTAGYAVLAVLLGFGLVLVSRRGRAQRRRGAHRQGRVGGHRGTGTQHGPGAGSAAC